MSRPITQLEQRVDAHVQDAIQNCVLCGFRLHQLVPGNVMKPLPSLASMENKVVEVAVADVNEVVFRKELALLIRAVIREECESVQDVPVSAKCRALLSYGISA